MDPVSTFCLASVVFLSLPLPLFAGVSLGVCPSLQSSLKPLVWANALVGSVTALSIIATSFPPLLAVTVSAATFIICGMEMFRRIALSNNSLG